jgi:hypothetical protein
VLSVAAGTLSPMIIAEWLAAGAAVVLALTSLVAVITWRESRRRDRDAQMENRIMESARKEFTPKEEVGGLKSNLIGFGVIGGAIAALVVWNKLDNNAK